MRRWINRLAGLKSREGQTTAEYAIIVALVAVSSIAVILIFGDRIRALFATEEARLGGDDTASQSDHDVGDSSGVVGGDLLD